VGVGGEKTPNARHSAVKKEASMRSRLGRA
jgi:hypothetical protein